MTMAKNIFYVVPFMMWDLWKVKWFWISFELVVLASLKKTKLTIVNVAYN